VADLHGVLVTYRRPQQLADTLRALGSQTRALDSLVVVDNDPEGSGEAVVASYHPHDVPVRYLRSSINAGAAGGNSTGMRHVLQYAGDDDWIVTLDDDDPPRTPELLDALFLFAVSLAKEDPLVGGVGLSGGWFDEGSARFRKPSSDQLLGPILSSWIGGNQLPLYRVSAVRAVGVFDDQYFINFEDLEYGLRMSDGGYKLYAHGQLWRREREHWERPCVQTSPARRLGEVSWRRYYSLRNLIFLLRTRGHQMSAFRVASLHIVKPLVNAPWQPRRAIHHLTMNARAIYDGYFAHMGLTVQPRQKDVPKYEKVSARDELNNFLTE
jgi:glycosyltransferase involved in cell wall biosynthesis